MKRAGFKAQKGRVLRGVLEMGSWKCGTGRVKTKINRGKKLAARFYPLSSVNFPENRSNRNKGTTRVTNKFRF